LTSVAEVAQTAAVTCDADHCAGNARTRSRAGSTSRRSAQLPRHPAGTRHTNLSRQGSGNRLYNLEIRRVLCSTNATWVSCLPGQQRRCFLCWCAGWRALTLNANDAFEAAADSKFRARCLSTNHRLLGSRRGGGCAGRHSDPTSTAAFGAAQLASGPSRCRERRLLVAARGRSQEPSECRGWLPTRGECRPGRPASVGCRAAAPV
jgi:hypothetical protein